MMQLHGTLVSKSFMLRVEMAKYILLHQTLEATPAPVMWCISLIRYLITGLSTVLYCVVLDSTISFVTRLGCSKQEMGQILIIGRGVKVAAVRGATWAFCLPWFQFIALSSFQIIIMLLFTLLIYATSNSWVRAQIDHYSLHLMTEALDWQPKTSIHDEFGIIDDDLDSDIGFDRRYLHEIRRRYISYGALSANNVPCEKHGMSYYSCSVLGRANATTGDVLSSPIACRKCSCFYNYQRSWNWKKSHIWRTSFWNSFVEFHVLRVR